MRSIMYFFKFFIFIFILFSCNDAVKSPYPPLSFTKIHTELGVGRASCVSFVIGEKAYIGLGRTSTDGQSSNDFWEFESTSNIWTKKNAFPGKARVNAVSEVVGGIAFVGLGYDPNIGVYQDDEAQLKDFWSYNAESDTWMQRTSFPSDCTNACSSFVVGSDIYVGLGFNGWSFENEIWKYSTHTDSWIQLRNSKIDSRTAAVACSNGSQIFIGTGYNTRNLNDWWRYSPDNDRWNKCQSFPDGGRQLAVSVCASNRFFVATGRHFGGDITNGFLYDDVLEYDSIKDCWYRRGVLPGGGRENAIAFSINGTCYIGFGENDNGVINNDLWSFKVND